MTSSIQPHEVPVREQEPKREFTTPEIIWEADTLGPNCSLNDNCQRLLNHTMRKPDPPPSIPYKFPGTRGTLPLTAKDLVYWEVGWKVSIKSSFKPGVERLLQLGAATEEVLKTATEDTPLEKLNKASITVVVAMDQVENEYDIWGVCGRVELDPARLSAVPDKTKSTGVGMGFFFDGPRSTMYVTKASDSCILWMSEVDVSQPLYPFVCVSNREKIGKEIWLQLKSGASIDMTEEKIKFLEDVIKGNVLQYKVIPLMS